MDFEEWFLEHGIPVDIDFNVAKRAYEAGQQSKQVEIDALQKRIKDALSEIESGITGKHHVKSIVKILNGESE